MSQLRLKHFLLFALSFFILFTVQPSILAENKNETEKLLVTYNEVKLSSRANSESSKVEILEVPSEKVIETKQSLESNDNVLHVEIDQPVYVMDVEKPNDPLFKKQEPWIRQINLLKAWSMAPESHNQVTVAVIDSGVDLTHPDLMRNLVQGTNLVNENSPPQDLDGHGTHVAGLIGARTNNSLGVISPSRGTSIMPIKVTANGKGKLSSVVDGIKFAIENKADVINLSLGAYNHSHALKTVVSEAKSKGILMVGAAGNDNESAVIYPAAYPEVLSVAALETGTANKATYSNYGSLVDLSVPGTDIYSTFLNGSYSYDSGTSMAAPIATSSAVLIKKYAPFLTNDQIIKLLKETSNQLSGTYDLGSGELNVEQAITGVNEYNRTYGQTAIDTAVEISKNNWSRLEEQSLNIGSETLDGKFVILARSDEFPDSLAASTLASSIDSPILLVNNEELSKSVIDEMLRLEANHVLLIGGENAISEKVSTTLLKHGLNPARIAGENRYKTAVEIAKVIDGSSSDTTFVVSGEAFPDALSVSSFASRFGSPILFTKKDELPSETEAFLKEQDAASTYIIGGESVIDSNVYKNIPSTKITRLGGEDRYDTNFKVLLHFGLSDASQEMYFATGLKFPDALTGGAIAARRGEAIMLVHPKYTNQALEKSLLYINNKGINNYQILGGPNAIPLEKAWEIDRLISEY